MTTYRTQIRSTRRVRKTAGFTLIEAAIVTAIIGIGIVSLLELLAAGSMSNRQSAQLTVAMNMAANVTEMMQGAPYSTLHATYDNKIYQPVRDGRGNPIVDPSGNSLFPNWKQVVDVQYVRPDKLTLAVPDGQYEDTARVTVNIFHHDLCVYTSRWIVAAPN
jgi:type II secretory pathway pseudopilin PulG